MQIIALAFTVGLLLTNQAVAFDNASCGKFMVGTWISQPARAGAAHFRRITIAADGQTEIARITKAEDGSFEPRGVLNAVWTIGPGPTAQSCEVTSVLVGATRVEKIEIVIVDDETTLFEDFGGEFSRQ